MDRPLVPVILCGGSGARLWPLSSADEPKQLLILDHMLRCFWAAKTCNEQFRAPSSLTSENARTAAAFFCSRV